MQVKVNGKTIEIFAGARVRDVLLKYSRSEWTLVRKKAKKVCDAHGHEVGLDGELSGGDELVVTECAPAGSRP